MPCRRCRVQFDRRELGVELIRDVDVMPCDPTENLPLSMMPQNEDLVRCPALLLQAGSAPLIWCAYVSRGSPFWPDAPSPGCACCTPS